MCDSRSFSWIKRVVVLIRISILMSVRKIFGFYLLFLNLLQAESIVSPESVKSEQLDVAEIVASEEKVLQLTPILQAYGSHLSQATEGKSLPISEGGLALIGFPKDLGELNSGKSDGVFRAVQIDHEERVVTSGPLEDVFENWELAQFGILQSTFDQSRESVQMLCSIEGRVTLSEQIVAVVGKFELSWMEEEGNWVVKKWRQKELKLAKLPKVLFREVLGNLVTQSGLLKELIRSEHQERTVEGFKTGQLTIKNEKHAELPDLQSSYQYPCVSIVDFDGDGWDDLFVSSRLGRVHLLRNIKGKELKDITREVGLSAIEGFVNNATFADFDNDGDPDLFLGRSLEPSAYFINEGGYFRDRTAQKMGWEEIYFVSSASVVDFNRDGLLDLYLCTYAPPGNDDRSWFERYYTSSEREEILKHTQGAHRYINLAGPPNVILMNRGGGQLEKVNEPSPLRAFRSSFQAVWADLDDDGDADCYLCNDFAPDFFFRNDTPKGALKPVFTDFGAEIAPGITMGFGMGASWGDYDADGDFDLYVSNMYSKAGKRIISMSGEVDERIQASAQGNFLYERRGSIFEQVAGKAQGQVPVEKVGWSFGGQFADFDNDGLLDLYVPSGYYSAPKEIATEVDL